MAQIDTSAIALPLVPAPNANPFDSRCYGPRGDCGQDRGVAFSLPLQVVVQAPFLWFRICKQWHLRLDAGGEGEKQGKGE